MSLATMESTPAEAVRRAIEHSELIRSIRAARSQTVQSRNLRPLTQDEIATLKSQNNAAEDWARVFVAQDFNPHKVVGCYFSGEIHLGSFKQKVMLEQGVLVGSGVYNCDLYNVSVGNDVLLSNNSMIANYRIGDGAIVQGCGSVVCTGRSAFGNDQRASLGLESPYRVTAFFAEIDVETAALVAGRRGDLELQASYEQAIADYRRQVTCDFGIIESGAVVKNTGKLLNVYVGSGAMIDGATWVENSTLLSNAEESVRVASGAVVRDSILQWGSRIETHAIVERSVCCEHSYVDNHGKVLHSLVGPNSGVASGECMYSLIGPFVGFHHQSLLIAAYWPQGKGTIGYGANVGSNHTSKAPDQEIWPGEGMFFGLSCSIKFPSDFSKAPYSIIASGVTTLPQRVEMPFSLINGRAESIEGISPAYNEILPGWVLSDNIYTVRRNERKYAIRDKASRSRTGFEVFRPEIVDLMVRARSSLQKAGEGLTPAKAQLAKTGPIVDAARRPVYTDKDIPGLGKNFLKETARLEGIDAYTFYIRLYALKGLYFAVRFCLQHKKDIKNVLEPHYIGDPRYDHELNLLLQEFPGKSVRALLEELCVAHEKLFADTMLSKEKDNFRGVRIIPDYKEVHLPAADDPFVKATQQETEEIKEEVFEILKRI
ncbi:MAG TPA: DUF4954 family protein [Planctomycetota bacterium]|nr:DUF4954 family protein [Planctomycetota bacterium]